MSTVKILGCGGAGINAGLYVIDVLQENRAMASIEFMGIDASDSNRDNVHQAGYPFYKLSGSKPGDLELTGSGAERSKNIEPIREGIVRFMRDYHITDVDNKTFYVVIHSLSGGSGSVSGPLLVTELVKRDIPTLVITIGDSASLKWAKNTKRTLENYHQKAKEVDTTITMALYDNSNFKTLADANASITGTIASFAVMASGNNESLDESDMASFIMPKRYKDISIPSGIAILSTLYGEMPDVEKYGTFALARILTESTLDEPAGLALHTKVGILKDKESFKDHFKADLLPISLLSKTGALKGVLSDYTKVINELNVALDDDDDIDIDADGVVL